MLGRLDICLKGLLVLATLEPLDLLLDDFERALSLLLEVWLPFAGLLRRLTIGFVRPDALLLRRPSF